MELPVVNGPPGCWSKLETRYLPVLTYWMQSPWFVKVEPSARVSSCQPSFLQERDQRMSTAVVVGQRALNEPDDLLEVPIEIELLGLVDSHTASPGRDQIGPPSRAWSPSIRGYTRNRSLERRRPSSDGSDCRSSCSRRPMEHALRAQLDFALRQLDDLTRRGRQLSAALAANPDDAPSGGVGPGPRAVDLGHRSIADYPDNQQYYR
jgi:hypothetical protein